MNKLIMISASLLLFVGCAATHQWGAEVPEWQEPGLAVNQMVRKQVANPNVIANPPAGVVQAYDGERTDNAIRAYRSVQGDVKDVEKPIQVGNDGNLN